MNDRGRVGHFSAGGEACAVRPSFTLRGVRILVIGAGGREHAILRALSRDPEVTALACAPGNAGTATIAESYSVDVAAPDEIAELAVKWRADLVVFGPETPLVVGAADAVRAAGIPCFGPSKAAARIEGSKAFAKDVMLSAGVPTAHSETVDNPAKLDAALVNFGPTWVVKDDGLAGGKGVLVTRDFDAARAHALKLLDDGHPVLLESFLDGPEASLLCLVDGTTVRPLLPAQDFKRVGDGDAGPNTGGMGAYAPLPWAPEGMVAEVVDTVVRPTAEELARRGTPYSGLLYAGLALTSNGPQVIEFNCRFGDPETQAILAMLRTPLATLLAAVANGELAEAPEPEWEPGAAVTVILAAEGYPGRPRVDDVIGGSDGPGVLHSGTRRREEDGAVLAAGGRVLSVVATGEDLESARAEVYRRVEGVHLPGAHYRTDIAARAARGEVAVPENNDLTRS
ncbi:phosphoribosylamine--glycine ligase [Actinopolyspora mzabensis]|uniref:Phosphoribosylamine--glycine ligase n=1 Tax=Actinopolyspora mzabensis TaxID=995066 RepID=A0A1G8X9P1_ACTMZ|nr:phosphoribosylamine--glycine ligase [Actinopolyspora mzabensis]